LIDDLHSKFGLQGPVDEIWNFINTKLYHHGGNSSIKTIINQIASTMNNKRGEKIVKTQEKKL
jgi:hypothetical protein